MLNFQQKKSHNLVGFFLYMILVRLMLFQVTHYYGSDNHCISIFQLDFLSVNNFIWLYESVPLLYVKNYGYPRSRV